MKKIISVLAIFICFIFIVFSFVERNQPYLFSEKPIFENVKENKTPKKKYKK